MEPLRQLVGREKALREVCQTLYFAAKELRAPEVGAMHLTCADETEYECGQIFEQGFTQHLLPQLKFASRSSFRLANLGGRYEWGAARLAEAHFATPAAERGVKLMLVKINAHVAFEELTHDQLTLRGVPEERPFRLGVWKRYGCDSTCCGALATLLEGGHGPAILELRETFGSEGKDRIAALVDEKRTDPRYRPLCAAVVSARLQARSVVLDLQEYEPVSPTLYVIVPCVTVNRHERDTEIVCGYYTIDSRDPLNDVVYFGLGDDPTGYEVDIRHRMFELTDEHVGKQRRGRNHRALVREEWKRKTEQQSLARDDRLDRIREDVGRNKHRNHHHAKALLRAALPILAEVAPVPAAVLLFAEGAIGIHHAYLVHRLAREMSGSREAQQMLAEIHDRIDKLEPDRAEALIELLMREYRS